MRRTRKFEAQLTKERVELLARLIFQPVPPAEPGGLQDNHPAEAAAELYDREEELSTRAFLLQRLAEVDAALQRIRNGTYGRCAVCGMSIPDARLQAVPTARLRVECQQRLEHEPWRDPPAQGC